MTTRVVGNGVFVNGVWDMGSGKIAKVLYTDYANFMILHVCDPSRGDDLADEIELLSRKNTTDFLDVGVIAKVFFQVVFVKHQNPLSIPFVGRCTCATLPPV